MKLSAACHIRPFQVADAATLWHLKFMTIRHVNRADYSQAQVEAWAPEDIAPEQWLQRLNQMQPLVAEYEQQLVGFADLQADGYIDHFFCAREAIGQGVGRSLMQALHQQASQQKLLRLYANVSLSAAGFFQHFGFKIIRLQQVTVGTQVLNNYLMEKDLNPH